MNNEFKIWCKDKNEWEKDECFLSPCGILFHFNGRYFMKLRKENHIILPYVGFKDKNDKEICAGDIDMCGYVVTYLANLNEGLGMNAGWYLQRDNFESWSELECNKDIEIIGNVFENPEKAINNCNTDYIKMF